MEAKCAVLILAYAVASMPCRTLIEALLEDRELLMSSLSSFEQEVLFPLTSPTFASGAGRPSTTTLHSVEVSTSWGNRPVICVNSVSCGYGAFDNNTAMRGGEYITGQPPCDLCKWGAQWLRRMSWSQRNLQRCEPNTAP